MTYTAIFTTIIPAPKQFYVDLGPQAVANASIISAFRASQPGFISQTSETISSEVRKLTIVFDSKETYDASTDALHLLPEYIHRTDYYIALDIVTEIQIHETGL